jgi:large subunit ribosomal protein L22
MKTSATAKYVGTSARKTGLVAGLIRGRSVLEAQRVLAATSKRATEPVGKVLASAVANAENNYNAKKSELMIEQVLIGPAPMLKRFRPRSRGSASSIHKHASHITVILTDQKSESISKAQATEVKAPKAETTKKPAAKTAAKPTAKKEEKK